MRLSNFQILRPPYETSQAEVLHWLIEAHTQAEKKKENPDLSTFTKEFTEKLWRVGCKPDWIDQRGHILKDSLHTNWDEMDVYRMTHSPFGENLSVRSTHFANYVDRVFETFYPEESDPPDELIHVSCTGYVAPSGAQKIASQRNWGDKTTVTHAYHMGCYGSIPALRIASGFLSMGPSHQTTDIVHTEICSLHMNPSQHSADQLVSQTLFADGFIKYTLQKQTQSPSLKLLATSQEIIPNSTNAMTWSLAHWGFQMTLAKEVPVLIGRALLDFVQRLAQKSEIPLETLLKAAFFAVHPGGPKILLYVQEWLKLSQHQMAHSFQILKKYGNMSSATLPHIWEAMLKDETVPNKANIVSLAFGPGLSITGSIMEKENICGS